LTRATIFSQTKTVLLVGNMQILVWCCCHGDS